MTDLNNNLAFTKETKSTGSYTKDTKSFGAYAGVFDTGQFDFARFDTLFSYGKDTKSTSSFTKEAKTA